MRKYKLIRYFVRRILKIQIFERFRNQKIPVFVRAWSSLEEHQKRCLRYCRKQKSIDKMYSTPSCQCIHSNDIRRPTRRQLLKCVFVAVVFFSNIKFEFDSFHYSFEFIFSFLWFSAQVKRRMVWIWLERDEHLSSFVRRFNQLVIFHSPCTMIAWFLWNIWNGVLGMKVCYVVRNKRQHIEQYFSFTHRKSAPTFEFYASPSCILIEFSWQLNLYTMTNDWIAYLATWICQMQTPTN